VQKLGLTQQCHDDAHRSEEFVDRTAEFIFVARTKVSEYDTAGDSATGAMYLFVVVKIDMDLEAPLVWTNRAKALEDESIGHLGRRRLISE